MEIKEKVQLLIHAKVVCIQSDIEQSAGIDIFLKNSIFRFKSFIHDLEFLGLISNDDYLKYDNMFEKYLI